MNEQADQKKEVTRDSSVESETPSNLGGSADGVLSGDARDTSSDEPQTTIDEQYPLRNASDDPRWAVWTVWIWFSIALFLLLFISILIILGLWFD